MSTEARAPNGNETLKLVPPEHCPACGQRIAPKASRVCAKCGKGILRGHKYEFIGSIVQHRVCEDPDAYVRAGRPA